LRGETPERTPTFDVVRNDAVIERFAGEKLTYENAARVTRLAHARAVDCTRMLPKLPVAPGTVDKTIDGRKAQYERWMRWAHHRPYESLADYKKDKIKYLAEPIFSEQERGECQSLVDAYRQCEREYLSEIGFFWSFGVHDKHQFGVESRSLQGYFINDLYEEVGVDKFCLWILQEPELISDLIERQFLKSIESVKMLPDDETRPLALFVADDLAFKTGPFLSPAFFEKEYFPRLKLFCDACHAKGIKVCFHTDGNLRLILRGLVDAGIDMLNPLEKVEFYVAEVHKMCPDLILTGSIDIGHLLPFGTPDRIRDQVRRNIEDAEGRIMIGSSSIMADNVPLENFLAMGQAVGKWQ